VSALLPRLLVAAALLAATPALAAKKGLAPGERLDLNRATVAELMRLPGLGEKKAQAIVAHRQKTPFRRPEEVTKVKGLGPAWFQKVKAHLVVGSPASVAATSAAAPAAPVATRR
jgi:competence protein ComEA